MSMSTTPIGPRTRHIDIVFDKPPGPVCPGFIEVEDDLQRSIRFARWVQRPDGLWALRITEADAAFWLMHPQAVAP